ncbi:MULTISPECIES: sugar phosphate isomerase/epimerase family protein [Prauserella salsuginis group]|uniref:Sugar phosphate isomerase/epimerase n=2 Tax=Prauserella salsuginis group TaxID=2893672 RepID=A0A839XWJ1_9PSEU|nr:MULTISPECIES: sugar phosphate isomerase/epimerase family protein [Prauserella salsuginis group]MBB3664155.1 sugar phosphate isomerase/epimerase [Prauserella sediminis]MCR3721608.1 Sugar phosphate isomerase/epimerase [Prauserella flava]MCR3734300.1 Sugar phosphate isomerase/epimerase [Prauserella salsuginis]
MNRLSLNQITTKRWSLPEAVRGCADQGVEWIGLWRDKIAEVGAAETARLLAEHGVRASSVCRGGFFTGVTPEGAEVDGVAGTREAIDETATVGADTLVLVVGGIAGGDLAASRQRVADAVGELAPYAAQRGVRLALEPLHPMQCAERSVLSTLDQALEIAQEHPSGAVGVIVDEFHVWWDPRIEESIAKAADRIAGFHVCDQQVPITDGLMARSLPGTGPIDHRRLRSCVEAAGYDGPIEVEVFDADLWQQPGDEVLRQVIAAYEEHVAPR